MSTKTICDECGEKEAFTRGSLPHSLEIPGHIGEISFTVRGDMCFDCIVKLICKWARSKAYKIRQTV